jgi:hypothetical protein
VRIPDASQIEFAEALDAGRDITELLGLLRPYQMFHAALLRADAVWHR